MTTVVYSNTDKPYDEWKPAYVIVSSHEKGTWRPKWIPWDIYQRAQPEADKLIADFWKEGRWGIRITNTARWVKPICEAIVDIVNSNVEGIKCIVTYPPFEENHCRVFILERK